jgi:phage baseplate assembly protein W
VSDDRHLLTDVALTVRHRSLRPVYDVATRTTRPLGGTRTSRVEDLETLSGRHNLGQALVVRLLTPLGELEGLGHPEYGSRLQEMVGRPNTATTRGLLKLAILDSVVRDPRVAEVTEVAVDPVAGHPSRVDVLVTVRPVGASSTVQVGPIELELAT